MSKESGMVIRFECLWFEKYLIEVAVRVRHPNLNLKSHVSENGASLAWICRTLWLELVVSRKTWVTGMRRVNNASTVVRSEHRTSKIPNRSNGKGNVSQVKPVNICHLEGVLNLSLILICCTLQSCKRPYWAWIIKWWLYLNNSVVTVPYV